LLEIQGKKESYYLPFAAPYLVGVDKDAKRVVMNEPDVLGGKE
jgi:ribosomal 30S subunit maturation factor RimM